MREYIGSYGQLCTACSSDGGAKSVLLPTVALIVLVLLLILVVCRCKKPMRRLKMRLSAVRSKHVLARAAYLQACKLKGIAEEEDGEIFISEHALKHRT